MWIASGLKEVWDPSFEGFGKGLDQLLVNVGVGVQDGWVWHVGHVYPVVGVWIIPAWFWFCIV